MTEEKRRKTSPKSGSDGGSGDRLSHLLLRSRDVLWVREEVLGRVVDDSEAGLRHYRHVPLARRDL